LARPAAFIAVPPVPVLVTRGQHIEVQLRRGDVQIEVNWPVGQVAACAASTVTNQGKASWMIIDGAFNHEKLIEFFQALVAEGQRAGKKVFLILDNLGVHHCKPAKTWFWLNMRSRSRSSTCQLPPGIEPR
jgi:hypothetical protein